MSLLACHADFPFTPADGPAALSHAVSFGALAAMLLISHFFVVSDTRGALAWPLRVVCTLAFVGICAAVVHLRPAM